MNINNFSHSNKKKLIAFAILAILFVAIFIAWIYFRYYLLFPGAAIEGEKIFKSLEKNKTNFLKEKFNISEKIAKNLIIKKNYVLYEKDPNQKKENQKTLVVFPGNGFSLSSILSGFKNGRYLEKYKPYDNIMLINYPSHAYSQNKVINYGYDAIKDLIVRGYNPENIDILGRSIGGGVSAQVLRKLKKEDDINVGNYVNFNSFSKINRVLPFAPKFLKEGFLRKIISTLSSLLFLGFSLNAAEAINDQGNFAAQNTTVIRTKGDEIIDPYASLSRKIINEKVSKIENIVANYIFDDKDKNKIKGSEVIESNNKEHKELLGMEKSKEIFNLTIDDKSNTHDRINIEQIVNILLSQQNKNVN